MTSPPAVCVVDTNVPIVANGAAPQISKRGQIACINALQALMDKGKIALDHRDLILAEYRKNLSLSGAPGVGDIFAKWAHDHEWFTERCHRGKITLRGLYGDCEEFPATPALEKFDLSDRKFVAVATVAKAPILNAADSDWKHHEQALAEVGIRVIFLCPEDLKEERQRVKP